MSFTEAANCVILVVAITSRSKTMRSSLIDFDFSQLSAPERLLLAQELHLSGNTLSPSLEVGQVQERVIKSHGGSHMSRHTILASVCQSVLNGEWPQMSANGFNNPLNDPV